MGKPTWPERVTRDHARQYWAQRDESEAALRSGVRRYFVFCQRDGDTAAMAAERVRAEAERLIAEIERGK